MINTEYKIKKAFSMNELSNVFYLNSIIFPMDDLDDLGDNYYWLAWKNKEPVGFACIKILDHGIGYMTRGGILDDHRGKGLHTRLIDARVKYAKKHKLKHLITYTVTDNVYSMVSLARRGFKIYNPEFAYAGDNVTYLIYSL